MDDVTVLCFEGGQRKQWRTRLCLSAFQPGGFMPGCFTVFRKSVVKMWREAKTQERLWAFPFNLVEQRGRPACWQGSRCQSSCSMRQNKYLMHPPCIMSLYQLGQNNARCNLCVLVVVAGMTAARKTPSSLDMAVVNVMSRSGSTYSHCGFQAEQAGNMAGLVQHIYRWYDLLAWIATSSVQQGLMSCGTEYLTADVNQFHMAGWCGVHR